MFEMKSLSGRVAQCIFAGLLTAALAHGQAAPSAYGAGASLWAGAEYSNVHAGFTIDSNVRLQGVGAFVDFNRSHSIGFEGHFRFLQLGNWYGETEQNYLAGPRYTFLHSEKWRPFASFEIGAVKIQYPFNMGNGTSFAMAPGGGLEYRLSRKWSVRSAFEYQILTNSPDFTNEPRFGIKPYGFHGGISYRIF